MVIVFLQRYSGELCFEIFDHHVEGVGAQEKRLTCDIPLWLHILCEIWLNKRHPLLYAAFEITASLLDVAHHLCDVS